MKRKGEREKHYFERMEALYGRMKAAGFSNEEINDIADYLEEKKKMDFLNLKIDIMSGNHPFKNDEKKEG
jgi:hypothetical protein